MNIEIESDDAKIAVQAAIEGGSHAKDRKDSVVSEKKSDGTVVTEADREAENKIREILGETEYDILGEEHDKAVEAHGTYWTIDPIDGTKNYSIGNPMYSTSVCLVKEDTPHCCCVYVPESEYVFYALEDNGAYLGSNRIEVSQNTNIDELSVVTGGYESITAHDYMKEISPWIQRFRGAVYASVTVPPGWNDFGVFTSTYPWDVSSGVLLTREAGGKVESIQNGSTDWIELMNGGFFMWNGQESVVEEVRDRIDTDELTESFKH